MRIEISVALSFLTSYLYSKLPRRRVNMLADEIERQLRLKYQNHWHVDKPTKGSGYRCLKFNLPKIDRVLINASREVGLDEKEILDCLPSDLVIWIDPGEVSYRIGERGLLKVLYSENNPIQTTINPNREDSSDQISNIELSSEDDSGCYTNRIKHDSEKKWRKSYLANASHPKKNFCVSSDVSSLWSYGPSSAISSGYDSSASRRSSPLFTTASFAQTKFGSTKLKCSSKRHHRMLPNEFSAYIKHRSQIQQASQHLHQQQEHLREIVQQHNQRNGVSSIHTKSNWSIPTATPDAPSAIHHDASHCNVLSYGRFQHTPYVPSISSCDIFSDVQDRYHPSFVLRCPLQVSGYSYPGDQSAPPPPLPPHVQSHPPGYAMVVPPPVRSYGISRQISPYASVVPGNDLSIILSPPMNSIGNGSPRGGTHQLMGQFVHTM